MNLLSDIKIHYVVDDHHNDEILKFDELDDATEHIQESEIIGYSQAMNYLIENDCSLTTSLTLAHDCGCSMDNVGSELLATLHHQDQMLSSIKEVIE